ncbi:MAG: IS110 family transposase, partial [Betaproteobacteria bacterium]|nr:IS110 family transposase [Betaproteobacteria bacterium]
MDQIIKYVGLDVHAKSIAVAVADMGAGEVRYLGEIGNDCEAIAKLVRRLKSRGTRLSFCY